MTFKRFTSEGNNPPYFIINRHQDWEPYLKWKDLQKPTAAQILKEGDPYRSLLEDRGLDLTKMAMLFVDKNLNKNVQQEEDTNLLKKCGLDSLVGIKRQPGLRPNQTIDVRQDTKDALIQAWHSDFKANPEKQSLVLAYSNRDVNDLNRSARSLLKESGHISRDDFLYTIAKMAADDFDHKQTITEEKAFSKGDRIVFTRNNYGLGVKNGTMGTITDLDKQIVQVKLNEGKDISFTPNLNPHFDQGWAITIHKSQGTTLDLTYVLASYEMTQSLAYVAMTRHRENVHIYGSNLDFWRPEKPPEVLAKSGEKLSAADYLDTDSLNKLMEKEDHLLTKIFNRISNELEAMGAVSKKVFWQVANHFLGINRDKEIVLTPEPPQPSVREETRAEEILKTKNDPAPETPVLISPELTETNFTKLTPACEQRLYDYLERHNMPLTSKRADRIPLQAERAAGYIQHAYEDTSFLPPEQETVNFCLRAKYELNRLPEIQRDLMDQGEANAYRAYRTADRLASIEGRHTFEAMGKGNEPPLHLSYVAKKELVQHREELPDLARELMKKCGLSEKAAQHCGQDILHYKETHGDDPSSGQINKMVEISRKLEHKDYSHLSSRQDADEIAFLRRREGDLLFRHGLGYDASRDLNHSQAQAEKSLRDMQRQIEKEQVQERQHSKQMEMSM